MSNRIANPLSVVGVFSGLAEISAVSVLPFLSENMQALFINYVIWFPVFIVVCFFLTLNFNNSVLYAPSDYANEKIFLELIKIKQRVKKSAGEPPELNVISENISHVIDLASSSNKSVGFLKLLEAGPLSTKQVAIEAYTSVSNASRRLSDLRDQGVVKSLVKENETYWQLYT